MKKEDKNMPPEHNIPPIMVVCLNPILSTKTPETIERKNVAPMVRDPTRAERKVKKNLINFKTSYQIFYLKQYFSRSHY